MEHYVGIDVSLEFSSICVVDGRGALIPVPGGGFVQDPITTNAGTGPEGRPAWRNRATSVPGLTSNPAAGWGWNGQIAPSRTWASAGKLFAFACLLNYGAITMTYEEIVQQKLGDNEWHPLCHQAGDEMNVAAQTISLR